MFWEYDSRTAHRWNIDPVTYPWQSSYTTFNNSPILFADPLGLAGTVRQNKRDAKVYASQTKGKLEKLSRGHYKVDISGTEYLKQFYLKIEGEILCGYRVVERDGVEILSPQKHFYADGFSPKELAKNPFNTVIQNWHSTTNNWHRMAKVSTDKPGIYSPYLPDAVAISVQAGADGYFGHANFGVGIYADQRPNGEIGGFINGDANIGLSEGNPNFFVKVNIAFIEYAVLINEKTASDVFAGTSVNSDIALGVFSIGQSKTSDFKTPFTPNNRATTYNLGIGYGVGVTNGVSHTWYKPFYQPSAK